MSACSDKNCGCKEIRLTLPPEDVAKAQAVFGNAPVVVRDGPVPFKDSVEFSSREWAPTVSQADGAEALSFEKVYGRSAVQGLKSNVYAVPPPATEEQMIRAARAAFGGGETRITDPRTGGQKNTKPVRFDLIPERFLRAVSAQTPRCGVDTIRELLTRFWLNEDFRLGPVETCLVGAARYIEAALGDDVAARYHIAKVYGVGAQKYDDNNWRKGYKWSLSYAAALRHLDAIERGEMMDEEMGVPHYANVWWHCATLWTFATEGLGTDDRPARKEAA